MNWIELNILGVYLSGKVLQVGDRCLSDFSLNPWYISNEHLGPNKKCHTIDANRNIGVVVCADDYERDPTGDCSYEDRVLNQQLVFNETCDETDLVKRFSCNQSKGLLCNAETSRCQCDLQLVRGLESRERQNWFGCGSDYFKFSIVWDGETCRFSSFSFSFHFSFSFFLFYSNTHSPSTFRASFSFFSRNPWGLLSARWRLQWRCLSKFDLPMSFICDSCHVYDSGQFE